MLELEARQLKRALSKQRVEDLGEPSLSASGLCKRRIKFRVPKCSSVVFRVQVAGSCFQWSAFGVWVIFVRVCLAGQVSSFSGVGGVQVKSQCFEALVHPSFQFLRRSAGYERGIGVWCGVFKLQGDYQVGVFFYFFAFVVRRHPLLR